MNERIHLRFQDYSPEVATFMLSCARDFMADKPNGAAGPGHGTGFRHGVRWCFAYWTRARAVVVVEHKQKEAP